MEFHTPLEALSVLGLDQNATREDIKSAYHRLAAYYHPDAHAADQAETTEAFLMVQQAYEYLMDEYDKAVAAYWKKKQESTVMVPTVPRVLGNRAEMSRQETNRHFARERVKQEKRLQKERVIRQRQRDEELAAYKRDTAYDEAMAKIHAIRAAEITANLLAALVLKGGTEALDKPFE